MIIQKRASFRMFLIILIPLLLSAQSTENDQKKVSFSVFPIAIYNSDIGFGFGGKGVIKNLYQRNESFDLILFGSSKGEQWHVFTFSIPDFEIRQGKQYPLSLDLKIEYSKSLKSNFFGFGNASEDNEWQFPREYIKLETVFGRAFSSRVIAEAALALMKTSVYDYDDINPLMTDAIPGAGEGWDSYLSLRARYDSRDSQIHPREGMRASANADISNSSLMSDWDYQRYRLELSGYRSVFYKDIILAGRIWMQHIQGETLYFGQSYLGGSWTLRGYKLERFIDEAFLLSSLETRFPIYRWFGGVVFLDMGRTFDTIRKVSLMNYHSDWGFGLRFYLTNFVVRFDAGVSEEGMRIFFHFGHVF